MKYLLIILIIVIVLWLARSKQTRMPPGPRGAKPKTEGNEPMIACAHCGLHIPSGEALPGRGGVFCGEAHRAAYEKTHPAE